MKKKINRNIIYSKLAPAAVGTYSQGVSFDNLIYTSGQIPLDPKTNTVVSPKFEDQINQVLLNIEQVLIAAGSNKNNILKLTVYLTDLLNFDKLNNAFELFFDSDFPARSVVEVSALPKNVLVEIEAICIK